VPETLGLTLSEAKELLQEVQRAMFTHQTTGYVTQQTHCPKCGKIQSRKGKHQIVLRTLFGKLRLDSPRLHHFGCCSKEEYRTCRVTDGANGTRVDLPGNLPNAKVSTRACSNFSRSLSRTNATEVSLNRTTGNLAIVRRRMAVAR
jgi:hypothetical protein